MGFPFNIPDEPYFRGSIDNRKVAVRKGDVSHTVWALQTALNLHGHGLVVDGVFGRLTDRSVRLWQEGRGLTVDGIAGGATQRDLVAVAVENLAPRLGLRVDAILHQVTHESGRLVGNHTARYSDRSFDAGLAQTNTRFHAIEHGFDADYALSTLCKFVRVRHDAYSKPDPQRPARLAARGLPTPGPARRWELAHGSWNRPAWAAWLAGQSGSDPVAPAGEPTAEQRGQLERYMDLAVADLYR